MGDVRSEFLDIVTQARTRLELQRALGVNVVEMPSGGNFIQQPVPKKEANPPVSPVSKGGEKAGPPLPKGGEGGFAAVQSSTLSAIQVELSDCKRCKLSNGRKTVVFGEGNPEAMLVFIGNAPGQEEDEQGRPFVGPAGQLLTDIIVKGMKLKREDVYLCTIMKCRTPDNRNPEPDEIDACERLLVRQLQAIKPKVIVALGDSTVKVLLKTKEGAETLRGKWQKYQGIPLMPTLHPADLLKNPSDKKAVWEDIKKVIAEMEKVRS